MKQPPTFYDNEPMQVNARLESGLDGDTVVYFYKGMPVFSHHVQDARGFEMITAQFCALGQADEDEIAQTYGVAIEGVRQAVQLYRDRGAEGFYPKAAAGAAPVRGPRAKRPVKGKPAQS